MMGLLLRRQKRRLEVVNQRLRVRQQTLKAGLHDTQTLLGQELGTPSGLACCFGAGVLIGWLAPSLTQLKHRLPDPFSTRGVSALIKVLRGGL